MSRVDTQYKNEWKLRIKEKPAYLGLPGTWSLKQCVFDVAFSLMICCMLTGVTFVISKQNR